MLLRTFPLLISLGQAAKILRGPTPPHIDASQATIVNGTLTSFSVIEGSGCPAGSYHAQPIEPGKSLNTYVDFDASIFSYNSTTSTAPVTCTVSFNYEFVYPEGGQAQLNLDTITYNDAQFEQGDVNRTTYFEMVPDVAVTASGSEPFNVSVIILFSRPVCA
jgi:hypothetical protein